MSFEISIQRLEVPEEPYALAAALLCAREVGGRLQWEDNSWIHAALIEDSGARFLAGVSQLRLDSGDEAYVSKLAVTRGYQGKGVGSLLVRHAADLAAGRGYKVLSTIPTARAQGRRFYERRGFRYDEARDPEHVKMFRDLEQEPSS